jgi:hypothetical protein
MYWIDQFVCLRRFESLSLHQVTQKLQVKYAGPDMLGAIDVYSIADFEFSLAPTAWSAGNRETG